MHLSFRKHTLRFKQPAGTSRGVYHERTVWLVYVDGVGIGECAPLHDLSCDALPPADYEKVLAEACRRTAEADGRIPYELLRPYPSILFGIETALLSYAAACSGNPYRLFDSAFSRGESGIVINGLVWMGTFEEMMERMEEKLALGFRCIKIKIGAIDWEREIGLIRALRERYPRDVVELRVDANGGFSPQQAPERLAELARYAIHSIEQPIRQGQWSEMAALCATTPIPIALDEELIGINDPLQKAALLDTIRPQYIILKPSLHGGLSGCEEWIHLAQERGISYWITSALESNVGLNAIAQWEQSLAATAPAHIAAMPQGLGTGQLFVENITPPHLEVRGDKLWSTTDKVVSFQRDYESFLRDWNSPETTIEVHTSGSTGTPKSIRVEKRRMEASARMTLAFLSLHEGDSALLCMPLRYIAGKMMVVRALVGNLRLQLVAPTSHPLRNLSDSIPTLLAVTPMQALATLRDASERALFERIPRIIIGGGSISPELHAALQSCEGEVYSTYGMTETLSHIAMRRLNGPKQSDFYTPLPGVSISQNADGCLVIDAPAVSPVTLVTNDLCELRPDGSFRVLGRRDNIICSGGIKLSLETLETKLGDLGSPYQLTAVPDALLGEALTLLHEGDTPNFDVIASRLDSYERPRHIYRVDALPITETGKPARAEARTMAKTLHEVANK